METSRIEYFTVEMENMTLESLKNRLIKSCTDFNQTSNNFKFEYDIKGGYIFCLLTCDIDSKCFPTMWRMLTVNAYESWTNIYYDGNVSGSHTLEDVKQRTINHLNHDLNKIKIALSK